jgi:nitrite reductase/ring-hydroxylating ferredoxin subunit
MADTETDADTALPERAETERGARRKGLAEHLRIPELQPAVRVANETDFPVGASRIVAWGDEPILVVRGSERFWAVQGTSPFDGCILRWEAESLRVVSPCTYVVYDLRGNVVSGLSLIPLKPFTAFVRRGTVYVTG